MMEAKDVQGIAASLQGMGAWFGGQGPQYMYAQQQQKEAEALAAQRMKQEERALSTERKAAITEDFTRAYSFMKMGKPELAVKLLDNRIPLITQLGGDPTDSIALREAISDPARNAEAMAELESFLGAGGIIPLPGTTSEKGYTLSPGQKRFDAAGNVISEVAPAPTMGEGTKPTSRAQDWNTYSQLKMTDPEAAQQFGRGAGFISKEGEEISVHLQGRLSDATDRANEARTNAVEFSTLADEVAKSDLRGGMFGGSWGEKVKDIAGSQDAVSAMRKRYFAIRSSMAIKNLPPGVASDKDIELALKGFPTDNSNKETIASFLRGMAKLEGQVDEFETFKAEYISDKGTERDLLTDWRARGSESPAQTSDASSEDAQALAWARANPNDPRAAAILQHAGGR